ncbi:hypothetical protein [Actinomadura rugatobispora]|uniref:Secreted protein n=1 Tax=Actinomadura rugatobispora TaxID=1994 RepID=A0ABW0ZTS9_9ACTN|nr:hypothetical protein GCM10010200_051330 [Actinomadura rugatobispora]
MKVARIPALTVAGAAVGFAVLTGGGTALADTAAPGPAAQSSTADVSVKATWNHNNVIGARSAGVITTTKATGTVKDTRKDGKCARVQIRWYGTSGKFDVDTFKACGYGKAKTVSGKPGDNGKYWTALSARVITSTV